jgi:pyruvate dehydrogenase (quinone)
VNDSVRCATNRGDAIVEALVDHDVHHGFGAVGDALNSFTDAIRRIDGIDRVSERHDEGGSYEAGAQAQRIRSPAVWAGTVGPGRDPHAHSLYDAAKRSAPAPAVAGQVPLNEMRDAIPFQDVDNDLPFRDVATSLGLTGIRIEQPTN